MKRIDLIDGWDDFDTCWWYEDGKYMDRDDQWDVTEFAPPDNMVQINFARRTFQSDTLDALVDMDFIMPDQLADLEPLLNPLVPS